MAIGQLLVVALLAVPSDQSIRAPAPAIDPALVRVCVLTDDSGEPEDLADRRQSMEDLAKSLTSKSKKKVLALVEDEEVADVVLEVIGRSVTTPRVVFGITARTRQPGTVPGPVRTALLQVSVALLRGDDPVIVTNKNKPVQSPSGWKSAADNIGDQIGKLITDRRAEILRRR